MRKYLRDPEEFRHVYRNGSRYDGVLLTVFVIENGCQQHRLGVTASRKAIGNAVQRNRAKRLLRETFRSSEVDLNSLSDSYDWVLNAKSKVLKEKLEAPLRDFGQIVQKIRQAEQTPSSGKQ